MNVINVNTMQHARVILLNINGQIMKYLITNATSVNTNLHDSHIKSKHEGYECDKCESKAAWQSYLMDHIKSKHEEDRYECNQCEYKASDKGNLSKHKT